MLRDKQHDAPAPAHFRELFGGV
ncbi:hypothetical protein CBM2600_A10211 [Cupriavidus taiwanensis]|nr:hypothetical protein CBM2600_A10211 [Cupriavidus taiwanensis]